MNSASCFGRKPGASISDLFFVARVHLTLNQNKLLILTESIGVLSGQGLTSLTETQRREAVFSVAEYWSLQGFSALESMIRGIELGYAVGATPDDFFAAFGYEGDGINWRFRPTDRTDLGNLIQGRFDDQVALGGDYGFYETWESEENEEQIHHLVYYMQVAYYNDDFRARVGNWLHERCGTAACSPEDFALGEWAIEAGDGLVNHLLSPADYSLLDIANRMRRELIYGN
ncbi:MAG: hypothetical protein ACE5E7_15975 [Anaerolineae bacterium]